MKNYPGVTEVLVYTDGSCHTQKLIGAWVAILLFHEKKIILQGIEKNTTHNRMELMAVIMAIKFIALNMGHAPVIKIVTDSQYVVNLPVRAARLVACNFITQRGEHLQNSDLLKHLINLFSKNIIELSKIKAHQKKTEATSYNIEADKLSRGLVRQSVNK